MFGTIHIVDDDASLRTALERRLKKAGYEVATYPSAQQLLDRLPDDNGPGCILLDVRMPGLSGPDLQTRLAELGQRLGTTERTIKAHRYKVMEKMGVQSLAELVSIAARHGVLQRLSGEVQQG